MCVYINTRPYLQNNLISISNLKNSLVSHFRITNSIVYSEIQNSWYITAYLHRVSFEAYALLFPTTFNKSSLVRKSQ